MFNRNLLIYLVFLFFIQNLLSQNNNENYNWNPLHTGDIWEYVDSYDAHHFRKVVKDTIINGRTYYKVEQFKGSDPFDWGIVYERIGDNATYLYDLYDWDNNPNTTELLSDSFNTPVGSSYISYKYYQEYNMPSEVRILDRYPSYLPVYDTTVTIVKIDRLPITENNHIKLLKTSQADDETWAEGFGLYEYVPETNRFVLLASIIDGKTYGTFSNISSNYENNSFTNFHLFQNYPNPFNPTTNIKFTVPKQSEINLSIYNIRGQLIKNIINGILSPGQYIKKWNGKNQKNENVSSGIYYCILRSGKDILKKKLILLR